MVSLYRKVLLLLLCLAKHFSAEVSSARRHNAGPCSQRASKTAIRITSKYSL